MPSVTADETPDLPLYGSPLINLASRHAQATWPKVVGRMDQLVRDCPATDYAGWVAWYNEQKPGAIDQATEKAWTHVQHLRAALQALHKEHVRAWVKDLVLAKSWTGIRIQHPILEEVARRTGLGPARLADAAGTAAGAVDGYLGPHPVQVKPVSYKTKELAEDIGVPIIYYSKARDRIHIDYSAVLPLIGALPPA